MNEKRPFVAGIVLVIAAIALWQALFVARRDAIQEPGERVAATLDEGGTDEQASPTSKSSPVLWTELVRRALQSSDSPKRTRIETSETKGRTLVVRVLDMPSGKPFADVPVILREQRLDPASLSQKPGSLPIYEDVRERSGTTDASGSVSFGRLRVAHHRVALDSGCVFGDDVQVDILDGADKTEQVVILAARPAIELTGLVIDPDAKPLAGVKIHAVARSTPGARSTFGTSDAKGRFSLPDVDPGGSVEGARRVLEIRAEHPKYLEPETMLFEAGAGTNEMPTIVMRSPGATIYGRIVDADGIPVPRTEVYLTRDGRDVRGGIEFKFVSGGSQPETAIRPFWSTNAEGRFLIEGLEPAVYELRCEKRCRDPGVKFELHSGSKIDVGDVRFAARKVELRGTAVFEDGSPAVSASLEFGSVSEQTNAAGEFVAMLCDAAAKDLVFRWHDEITGIDWEQITRAVEPGRAPIRVVLVPRGVVVHLLDAQTNEPVDSASPSFALCDSSGERITESRFGSRPKDGAFPKISIEHYRLPTDRLAAGRVAVTIRTKGYRDVETEFEIPMGGFTSVKTIEIRLEKM